MRASLFVLLFLGFTLSAALADDRPPVIDVHLHVYSDDVRWQYRIPNPASGQEMTATDEASHRAATLQAMDEHNVVWAVASNEWDTALRWREAAPDRILASYAFDGLQPPDVEFLRAEHAAGRLVALGEVGIQYEGIAPDDPRMEPWYELAVELDIPMGIHLGLTAPGGIYQGYPNYRAAAGDPLGLEEILVRHPKLRVYVMHAGWPMLDHMIALLWAHPQVYVDVSVINWAMPRAEFHSYLKRLVDVGFGDRILFGSDQMVWPESIGLAIEGIESAEFLSDDQKHAIFYDNAVRFFRLGDGR